MFSAQLVEWIGYLASYINSHIINDDKYIKIKNN